MLNLREKNSEPSRNIINLLGTSRYNYRNNPELSRIGGFRDRSSCLARWLDHLNLDPTIKLFPSNLYSSSEILITWTGCDLGRREGAGAGGD